VGLKEAMVLCLGSSKSRLQIIFSRLPHGLKISLKAADRKAAVAFNVPQYFGKISGLKETNPIF
jgi:hypothetical protein